MPSEPACRMTHPLLEAGPCPWCECPIRDGVPITDSSVTSSSPRRWNIATITESLDDADPEVRSTTVTNLMFEGPSADQMVPLLAKALADPSIRDLAFVALSFLGYRLSDAEAQGFEQQVKGAASELAFRVLLLGYYFAKHPKSETDRFARKDHILWLIQNAPRSDVAGKPDAFLRPPADERGYEQAKRAWLKQIEAHPADMKILGNAANFFLLPERDLAEELLEKARSLEPDSPEWPKRLGQLHQLAMIGQTGEQRRDSAARSLAELEKAASLGPDKLFAAFTPHDQAGEQALAACDRMYALPNLAKSAFEAGEIEWARNYASELLDWVSRADVPESQRDGGAVHIGNVILGRIALQMGDVEAAKMHLLDSGGTSGSSPLCSFGPNMSLAKDLLECGETDVVLEYFRLCAKFWEHGADRLEAWTAEVRCGSIPDFGANLNY